MCWWSTSSLPRLVKSIARRILASARGSGLDWGSWQKWLRGLVWCQVCNVRLWDLTLDNLYDIPISGKEFYAAEVRKTPWGSQNCYWDEKSIDVQWDKNQARAKQIEYRTGKFRKYWLWKRKVSEVRCRGNQQGWLIQRKSVGNFSVSPMGLLWLRLWR